MLFVLFLTLVLTLFWVLLSWHFTPFLLGCGIASIALTLYLALRMKVVDEEFSRCTSRCTLWGTGSGSPKRWLYPTGM